MTSDTPPILRPMPRRPFSLATSPSTASSSRPVSPSIDSPAAAATHQEDRHTPPPSRTRSILNLTSSTLFGIYSPTGYSNERDGTATPWGTGSETPLDGQSRTPVLPQETNLNIDQPRWQERTRLRRSSLLDESAKKARLHTQRAKAQQRRGFKTYWVPLAVKNVVLGAVGMSYGAVSYTHLTLPTIYSV